MSRPSYGNQLEKTSNPVGIVLGLTGAAVAAGLTKAYGLLVLILLVPWGLAYGLCYVTTPAKSRSVLPAASAGLGLGVATLIFVFAVAKGVTADEKIEKAVVCLLLIGSATLLAHTRSWASCALLVTGFVLDAVLNGLALSSMPVANNPKMEGLKAGVYMRIGFCLLGVVLAFVGMSNRPTRAEEDELDGPSVNPLAGENPYEGDDEPLDPILLSPESNVPPRRQFDAPPRVPRRHPAERDTREGTPPARMPWALILGGLGLLVALGVGGGLLISRANKKPEPNEQASRPAPALNYVPPRPLDDMKNARPRTVPATERADWGMPPKPDMKKPDVVPPIPIITPPIPDLEKPDLEPREQIAFKLPPLPPLVKITPAETETPTNVKLPGKAASVIVAAGGRYLAVHVPSKGLVSLFDTSAAKIIREFPAKGKEVRIAAGMHDLLVYRDGMIEKFALADGGSRGVAEMRPTGPLVAFCMGSRSDGPLLIAFKGKAAELVDVESLKQMSLPPQIAGVLKSGRYWADSDGRIFGSCRDDSTSVVIELASDAKRADVRSTAGRRFVIPAGKLTFIDGSITGVVNAMPASLLAGPHSGSGALDMSFVSDPYLPTEGGRYYFHIVADREPIKDLLKPYGTVQIYSTEGRPVPRNRIFDVPLPAFPWKTDAPPIQESVRLIPAAKLLVVVPEAGDVLDLYPFDPSPAAQEDLPQIYPAFKASAVAKTIFNMKCLMIGKGVLKARKLSGPDGLTVTEAGIVTWKVPANWKDGERSAVIGLTDGKGTEDRVRLNFEP